VSQGTHAAAGPWRPEAGRPGATAVLSAGGWIMRLQDGKVVDGAACYDSIAFNELWELAPSAS
jgi:hypothetical protein